MALMFLMYNCIAGIEISFRQTFIITVTLNNPNLTGSEEGILALIYPGW